MTIRVGEVGKKIYVITSYDMSSNTSLQIIAVPPSGETNQKTWTATLQTSTLSNITLEDGTAVTTVAANESMYYETSAATDLDEAGTWTLIGKFTNTSATPDDVFISDPVTLVVSDDNYSA